MNEVTIFGSISRDGKLKGVFSRELNSLLDQNKGKRITVTISVIPDGVTPFQAVYFKKVILPKFQEGMRQFGDDMSLQGIEEFIYESCPATSNMPPDSEKSKEIMRQVIEWSIRTCAEEFSIVVPEPNCGE